MQYKIELIEMDMRERRRVVNKNVEDKRGSGINHCTIAEWEFQGRCHSPYGVTY